MVHGGCICPVDRHVDGQTPRSYGDQKADGGSMNYVFHILIMIALYVVLGLSLNLVAGHSGLLSICHGAFYGVGAYATTLLMVKAGWEFLPALSMAVVASAILSLIVGIPSLRLKGDFFVLATIGFQMIMFSVLYNWTGLTHGPYGIPAIPRPVIFGWRVATLSSLLLLSFLSAAFVIGVCWQLARSPYGRALRAVRDDELAATALGKNPMHLKTTAFIFSAGLAAIAGGLYAGYVTYIDPTSFGLEEAIFILSLVIIGGAGNLKGPIIGAVFMVVLPELLRFLQVPDMVAPNIRQIIYGLLLIVAMRFRPQGIAGRYAFD
jgi:branched-chain amino acid transport system permease protein